MPLFTPFLPALVGALATGLGSGAAGLIIDGLRPKPKPPPAGGLSPADLQAIRALTDALNRVAEMRPPVSPDALWQVGDAMQAYANRQPDYLEQALATLRENAPAQYDFAKQLEEAALPAFEQSPYVHVLVPKVGPAPTQPSAAQPWVLPGIKEQPFPEQIKEVPWPETTPFVWPEITPEVTLPTQPSAFTFPGQAGGETEGQRALSAAQDLINQRAQEYLAQQG